MHIFIVSFSSVLFFFSRRSKFFSFIQLKHNFSWAFFSVRSISVQFYVFSVVRFENWINVRLPTSHLNIEMFLFRRDTLLSQFHSTNKQLLHASNWIKKYRKINWKKQKNDDWEHASARASSQFGFLCLSETTQIACNKFHLLMLNY